MAKNSRSKGNRLELQVAKIFAEALGLEIRRTPLSGGWAKGSDEVHGDLVCVDPGPEAFSYCVECKNQEGWRLESLFTSSSRKWFDKYWAQLLADCPANKTPVLVFSRAYCPTFASFPVELFYEDEDCGALNMEWDVPYLTIKLETGLFVAVMLLDAFVEHILV